MHTLPCVRSIVPQLRVMYDDEPNLPFGVGGGQEWVWVVSVKRVYLWDAQRQRLLRSEGDGIMDLVAFYLLSVHGMDFFGKKRQESELDAGADQMQRVKMTDFGHARFVRQRCE